jgi:hemerythrin-like domain-containing protein
MMESNFRLDMTMMLAVHDAFRRDLDRLRVASTRSSGWEFFERMLRVHNTAEDDALWPMVRRLVVDDLDHALLDEMAAEHAEMAPLVDAVAAALPSGRATAGAARALAARLEEHLAHEEASALPLIDRTLTEEQWMSFGQVSAEGVGDDMPRFLPWLLADADPARSQAILSGLPEHVQHVHRTEWVPAYAARDWWSAA